MTKFKFVTLQLEKCVNINIIIIILIMMSEHCNNPTSAAVVVWTGLGLGLGLDGSCIHLEVDLFWTDPASVLFTREGVWNFLRAHLSSFPRPSPVLNCIKVPLMRFKTPSIPTAILRWLIFQQMKTMTQRGLVQKRARWTYMALWELASSPRWVQWRL